MKAHEFWDVGEASPFPNLGKTSTARVMQALIRLGGGLLGLMRTVHRISLPVGQRLEFEKLVGYPLTRPAEVKARA